MSEQTGKVIYKSIMWIAIGAVGVAAIFAPTLSSDLIRAGIAVGAVYFGGVVTVQD